MKKIRILSIDGGGIKGIIPATIVSHLEKMYQEIVGDPSLKIANIFDVIAGTSTGGILTALYLFPDKTGKPKFHAKEAIDIYKENGRKIFNVSLFQKIKTLNGITDQRYFEKPFEEILSKYLGDKELKDIQKIGLFCSYEINRRNPFIFNTIMAKKQEKNNFYLRDVVRATTAAPSYFSPANITSFSGEQHCMIDGFVSATNPALLAYAECRDIDFSKLLNDDEKPVFPTAKDMIIVSIGTGIEKTSYSCTQMQNKGMLHWIKPIIDFYMSGTTEITHLQLSKIFSFIRPVSENTYFRLEPSRAGASAEMDDASEKNIEALVKAGERYVYQNKKFLKNITQLLIEN